MAFLRSVSLGESLPHLLGQDVYLRVPSSGDYADWAELRARSRAFLTPWEPTWASDELTRTSFKRRLRQYQKDLRDETGYAFFAFRNSDRALIGGLSLTNVRRGVTQSVTLGYWMGAPYAGRGYMTQAVGVLKPFVFGHLLLHRLEAACLLDNEASTRVLDKAGFTAEGIARRYLKINGAWQDHRLFGLVAEDMATDNQQSMQLMASQRG
jgi:[ribosomal protein S5]-alanine N-acetyltransferase